MANYCHQYNRFCEFATEYGYCMVTACKKLDKVIPSNGIIYVPFSKLKEYMADDEEDKEMKKEKWIKEIEEAEKKLEEYKVLYTDHICSMPFNFMKSIMAKLMGSIPISYIEDKIKEHESESTARAFCSSLRILINLWEEENES